MKTKELKSKILKRAHELTKQFVKKYNDVDYKTEFGLILKLVYEELNNGILEKEVTFPFAYKENKTEYKLIRIQPMEDKTKVLQGIVSINNKDFYFVAGKEHAVPVVFGATNINMLKNTRIVIEEKYPKFFEKDIDCFENDPVYNFKELKNGVFCYSTDNVHFRGYYRNRAFEWNIGFEEFPRTCAFSTLIKDLDRPGKKSFRSMKGAGIKIESEIGFIKNLCNDHYSEFNQTINSNEDDLADGLLLEENNAEEIENATKETRIKIKKQLSMLNRLKNRNKIINDRAQKGQNMFGEKI